MGVTVCESQYTEMMSSDGHHSETHHDENKEQLHNDGADYDDVDDYRRPDHHHLELVAIGS